MRRYHACRDREEETSLTDEVFPSCQLEALEADPQDCPLPDPDDDNCCCKASMVDALGLLRCADLAALVDFDSFFFLTDSLTIGGNLRPSIGDTDNINSLTASFRRFSPCNCDLIDVRGTAFFAIPGGNVALEEVDQLSLCSLNAAAFTLSASEDPTETENTVYRRAVRLLRRAIRAEEGYISGRAACGGQCDCDDCCCNKGLLAELAARNLSRQVTLTVGPLVLQNVTVLGTLGSVLVLANETQRRIYFVCVSQVEALG